MRFFHTRLGYEHSFQLFSSKHVFSDFYCENMIFNFFTNTNLWPTQTEHNIFYIKCNCKFSLFSRKRTSLKNVDECFWKKKLFLLKKILIKKINPYGCSLAVCRAACRAANLNFSELTQTYPWRRLIKVVLM